MIFFDSFDIDLRPSQRRTVCGLSGISAQIACYGILGNSESKQSSASVNQQATTQGGGEGSGTVTVGAQSNNNTVEISSTDPQVVSDAFQFGAEAQTQAAQTVGASNSTIQYISDELAKLTSNATPQTTAAQAENLQAGSTGASGFDWNKAVDYALIAGTLFSALVFFRTKGKSA